MRILQNTQSRPVGGVSFGFGGRILVAGGSGGYNIWDLTTSSHTLNLSQEVKYLYGCVCDPLGRWVYVSDYRGGFRLLPLDEHEIPPPPGSQHERHVISFALTADGGRLVMSRGGAGFNRVECWDVRPTGLFAAMWSILDGEPVTPDEPYFLNQSTWFFNGVAISHNGERVATADTREAGASGIEPLVVLRDGDTGRSVAELGRSMTSFDTRLAFAPNGRTLFTWDNRVLEQWDLVAGRQMGRLTAGRAYVQGLAIHPSGQFLLTVAGNQVRYWDTANLSPIRALKWGIGKLHSVAISPDGSLAAAGGDKGQVVVWDVEV